MSATMKSAYSQVQVIENTLSRTLSVHTMMGAVQIRTEAGELPTLVVSNDMIGSSFIHLDDNAIGALSYELNRYLAIKRERA